MNFKLTMGFKSAKRAVAWFLTAAIMFASLPGFVVTARAGEGGGASCAGRSAANVRPPGHISAAPNQPSAAAQKYQGKGEADAAARKAADAAAPADMGVTPLNPGAKQLDVAVSENVVTIAGGDTVTQIAAAITGALAAYDTVIVEGTKSGVVNTILEITIASGKKVEWRANYSGTKTNSGIDALINLHGKGTFEVTGGLIENTVNYEDCYTIGAKENEDTLTIIVNGGTVKGNGTTGAAVFNQYGLIELKSGSVLAAGTANCGIISNYGRVNVSGGTITTADGAAIVARGDKTVVSGGILTATGAGGGCVINCGANAKSDVEITGGTLSAVGVVILNQWGDITVTDAAVTSTGEYGEAVIAWFGDITISNSAVKATGSIGWAVEAYGGNIEINSGALVEAATCAVYSDLGNVTVNGGTVRTDGEDGYAISASEGDIEVKGGMVEANKGAIWSVSGDVSVSGTGKVKANGSGENGWAIELLDGEVTISESAEVTSACIAVNSHSGGVTMSGGTVTAFVVGIYAGSGNVEISGGAVTATGNGVIPAWAGGQSWAVEVLVGDVSVSGGTIRADGDKGYAILDGDGAVTVRGGAVEAKFMAICNVEGSVEVSGTGKVKATGNGVAKAGGWAIQAENGDVVIEDYAEITSDRVGIYSFGGNVTVNSGIVRANGWAIDAEDGAVVITINGGVVAGKEAGIYVDVSTNDGVVVIDGGSITSVITTDSPRPKNGADDGVYLNTLTVGGTPQRNAAVTAASVRGVDCDDQPDAASGVYGIKEVKTDGDGKVYFWLPVSGGGGANAEEITVTANGGAYKNTFARAASANAKTLRRHSVTILSAEQAGGASGTADSTGVELTFSAAVTGLTADDITLTDGSGAAVKGSLTGGGVSWTIALSSVTTAGSITVTVADFGDYAITSGGTRSVEVYKGASSTSGSGYAPYTPIEPPAPTAAPPTPAATPGTPIGGGSTVETPSGKPPITNSDGTTTLLGGGSITTPGGATITVPGGTVISEDGKTITIPRGFEGAEIRYADGRTEIVEPGRFIELDDDGTPLGGFFVNPFIDVFRDDWFYDGVIYCYTRGLLGGTSGTTFSPQMSMTRGMMVTVLWNMAGQPTAKKGTNRFDDVNDGDYCAKAAAWARSAGVVSGTGNNMFSPDAPISRQDLAVMLHSFAKAMGRPLTSVRDSHSFLDEADTASYAKDAIDAFFCAGIISGKPGDVFDPKGEATRAEIATLLHLFAEMVRPR